MSVFCVVTDAVVAAVLGSFQISPPPESVFVGSLVFGGVSCEGQRSEEHARRQPRFFFFLVAEPLLLSLSHACDEASFSWRAVFCNGLFMREKTHRNPLCLVSLLSFLSLCVASFERFGVCVCAQVPWEISNGDQKRMNKTKQNKNNNNNKEKEC